MSGPDGVAALKGARLALAQLAVDAETLIKEWHERERVLRSVWQTQESRIEAAAIAKCREELEALLKLWQID